MTETTAAKAPRKRTKRPRKLAYPLYELAPVMQEFGANSRIYSQFGQDGHNGIDLGVQEYTPILAAHSGTVAFAGDGFNNAVMGSAAGNCVLLKTRGYMTGYAHLSRVYVKAGEKVKAGDVIGLSGKTGAVTGPHLHMELLPLPLALDNGYLGRAPFTLTPPPTGKVPPAPVDTTTPTPVLVPATREGIQPALVEAVPVPVEAEANRG